MARASAQTEVAGSLRESDGAGVVRLQARLDAGIDDLWSALTDPGRLGRWLGDVDGDLRQGGEFRGRWHASGWSGTGRVEECEPRRRFLVVTTSPHEPNSTVEVLLTADGAQTVLVLEDRGLPLALLAAYGAGDQVHVEDLASHLAGGERCDARARWQELHPGYSDLAAALPPATEVQQHA